MSPRAAAPSNASVTACIRTSASLCPTMWYSNGTSIPPSRSGPPSAKRWVSCPIPIRNDSVPTPFAKRGNNSQAGRIIANTKISHNANDLRLSANTDRAREELGGLPLSQSIESNAADAQRSAKIDTHWLLGRRSPILPATNSRGELNDQHIRL